MSPSCASSASASASSCARRSSPRGPSPPSATWTSTSRTGETVALVGESGSGKTTLGRATLHLVPISSGRIVFEGTDVGALEGRELRAFRQRAQVIFQDPFSSLSPYMRVGEIVEEPLVIHGPRSRDGAESARPGRPGAGQALAGRGVRRDVPAHALGWAAAARQHRAGHGAGPRLPRGRRAGLHDRRLQSGRDPLPAQGPPGAARADVPVHHARPGQRAPLRRPHRGHVRGTHRGAGAGAASWWARHATPTRRRCWRPCRSRTLPTACDSGPWWAASRPMPAPCRLAVPSTRAARWPSPAPASASSRRSSRSAAATTWPATSTRR